MDALFTPEQLAEIRAYRAPLYVRAALADPLHLLLSLALLRLGIRPLWRAAHRGAAWLQAHLGGLARAPGLRVGVRLLERLWGGPGWGEALLFVVLSFGLVAALWAPADVWFGYVHEKRFGLSVDTPSAFALRYLRGQALGLVALTLLAFGLYGLARRLRRWWLVLGVCAGVALLFSAALDPYRSRLSFRQEPLAEGPLRQRVVALLARAQVPFREVLVEKTSVASTRIQAYFAGQGATRTIVLNDVLLSRFTEEEVLAVVAHEAAHVHEPRWPGRVASALALVAVLFGADRLMRLAARRRWFGVERVGDVRTLPLLMTAFFLLLSVVSPVSRAFGRARELEADRYGVHLTGDVAAFRSMLVKAARINRMDPDPPRWVVLRGFSHPPIAERLAALPSLPPPGAADSAPP